MSDSINVENVQVLNGGEVTLDGGRKKHHHKVKAHKSKSPRRSRMRGGKVAPVADALVAESLDGGKKKKYHKRSLSRRRMYGGEAEESAPVDADIFGGAVEALAEVDQTLEGGKKHKKHHKRSHSRRPKMMMYGGDAEASPAADDFDAAIFGGAVEVLSEGLDQALEGGKKKRSGASERGLKAWVAAVKHENMGRVPAKGSSAYRRVKAYMNKL